ncbi:hypothetical protein GCM10007108_15190 [Thermogymnomonas acidicola]|uniref:UPF0200 protein GCM10007108_15190 n=1 Tax=Thermogymnomonas acidicola TaxID=399579 RepID=A0AA37BSC7_9ARCH|nr:AAA family ATPase [Thermogymnomonas acidicola]GGM77939.1 hypothetical protein GCM10007108_15190 [Thermogymnomonas acidicola]
MIVVTGMPGAGKDEFIAVARSVGFMDVHMGESVRHYARLRGIPFTDGDIGRFAASEREKYGMDIWARRTAEMIRDPERTVVDGVRNMEEVDAFRERDRNLIVIAIFANREERFRRILGRQRPDDVRSMAELVLRDKRELSFGIGSVIALADVMIVNDGTLEEFREKSRKVLQSLPRP